MINQHIYLAVDAILFTVIDEKPHVLLVKRKNNPFSHKLAFPGGFVKDHETLKEAVMRKLEEETNLKDIESIEVLDIYDSLERDPRGRVISVAFIGVVNFEQINHLKVYSNDILTAEWIPINEVKSLAFDHNIMFADSLNFLSTIKS